jgi:hypothetical protein
MEASPSSATGWKAFGNLTITLGNTGLLVSKLCCGAMTFGDGRGIFKAISSVVQAAMTDQDVY